jgi:hypothetical protein
MKSISFASKKGFQPRAEERSDDYKITLMKDSNDPNELNSKLDQLDIHSAVLRRGSLPHRSRPQSVKQPLPKESAPQGKPLYE